MKKVFTLIFILTAATFSLTALSHTWQDEDGNFFYATQPSCFSGQYIVKPGTRCLLSSRLYDDNTQPLYIVRYQVTSKLWASGSTASLLTVSQTKRPLGTTTSGGLFVDIRANHNTRHYIDEKKCIAKGHAKAIKNKKNGVVTIKGRQKIYDWYFRDRRRNIQDYYSIWDCTLIPFNSL